MMQDRTHGFTLIEMMAVVVIIGILAAIIAPRYFTQVSVAERTRALEDIRIIEQAISLYRFDTGQFPETLGDLVQAPDSVRNWNGPYLRAMPRDPWDNLYEYQVPGQNNRLFDVWSKGQDGKVGGDGLQADIYGQ